MDMFKCPVCNGNVRTGPDDVVVTCPYCGSTTTIEGKEIGAHLMETAKDEKARLRGFRKFLEKNKGINKDLPDKAEVVEHTLIYVPVWTAKVKADTRYRGYRTVQVPVQRTRTVTDSDGRTHTETYTDYETGYVPVDDEIHTVTDEPLLARRGARFYGLEEYLNQIDVKDAEKYDFSKIKDLNPTILNAEIGQEEFEKAIHSRVSDRHREQAKSRLTELFDCRTVTEVRDSTYLQVPFVLIRYKYKGDLYKVAMDGHEGKVVIGEIPITRGQRALWTIVGLIGTVLAGFGAQMAYLALIADTFRELALGGLLAVIGIVLAVFGYRVLFMTQREKRG